MAPNFYYSCQVEIGDRPIGRAPDRPPRRPIGNQMSHRAFGFIVLSLMACSGCRSAQPRTTNVAPARDSIAAAAKNELGLERIEQEDFAGAERVLREAIAADQFYGPAYSNLGVCLLSQERYYDAAWQFRHAAQLMPRASAPRMNLGLLYEAVGRFGPAESELSAALTRAPADVTIMGHLARLNIRQNKPAELTYEWLEQVATEHADANWREWAQLELSRASDRLNTSRPSTK